MRKKISTIMPLVGLATAMFSLQLRADTQAPAMGTTLTPLEQEVRHQLVMLPFYGIFDNLEFKVDGTHVTLSGQVTRPTLKVSAESLVQRLPGVSSVTNQIEVLPLSPNDDRIRYAVWRAVYSQEPMLKYGIQAIPPIHIIVKGGNVTLVGMVNDQADSTVANLAAKGVSGVFSVTNHLRTEHSSLS